MGRGRGKVVLDSWQLLNAVKLATDQRHSEANSCPYGPHTRNSRLPYVSLEADRLSEWGVGSGEWAILIIRQRPPSNCVLFFRQY